MIKTSPETSKSELTELFSNGNEGKLYLVPSKGSFVLKRSDDFVPNGLACLICERNFLKDEELSGHYREHRQGNRNIKSMECCDEQILDLQYKKHLAGTKFGFMLRSKCDDIIIENIILMAPVGPKYFREDQVPFALSEYTDFLVTFLPADMRFLQKIFVVFYHKETRDLRRIECFEFKAFFEGTIGNTQLENDIDLESYPVATESSIEMIKEYLKATKLEEQNASEVFEKLVQLEDYAVVAPYRDLVINEIALQFYEFWKEEGITLYWVDVPTACAEIFEIIKPNDEALVSTIEDPDFEYVGFVNSVSKRYIYIELYGNFEEENVGKVNVRFNPCRLPIRYQFRALDMLGVDAGMRKFLFPTCDAKPRDVACDLLSLNLINPAIGNNPEQLQAVTRVIMGLNQSAPYIIFGPPGTGKTTTVVETILQLRLRNPKCRVLVAAGSNSACDTLALRLVQHFNKTPHAEKCYELLRICSKSATRDVSGIDVAVLDYSNCCLKILEKRSRRHSYPIKKEIMKYGIIVATLGTVGKLVSASCGPFDYILIDEAGASTEPETLIAIMGIRNHSACQVILSGDHKQLGPVITSTTAAALGLEKSLMMRLMELECYQVDKDGRYDSRLQTRLRRNYRSHPEIVRLYNMLYYNNELLAEVKPDDVRKFSTLAIVPNAEFPIIFKPVYGKVAKEPPSMSSYNQMEISAVLVYLKRLLNAKVGGETIRQKDIGVITPYKLQSEHISSILKKRDWRDIEVGSVEKFQGQEKQIIIASFVRSFSCIGFVSEPRRLNVLLSRAKSLLIMIGNPKTLSQCYDFRFIINETQLKSGVVASIKEIEVTTQDTKEQENSVSCNTTKKESEDEPKKSQSQSKQARKRQRYKENKRAFKEKLGTEENHTTEAHTQKKHEIAVPCEGEDDPKKSKSQSRPSHRQRYYKKLRALQEKCASEENHITEVHTQKENERKPLALMHVNDNKDKRVRENDMSVHNNISKTETSQKTNPEKAHNQRERNIDGEKYKNIEPIPDGQELAKYEREVDCENEVQMQVNEKEKIVENKQNINEIDALEHKNMKDGMQKKAEEANMIIKAEVNVETELGENTKNDKICEQNASNGETKEDGVEMAKILREDDREISEEMSSASNAIEKKLNSNLMSLAENHISKDLQTDNICKIEKSGGTDFLKGNDSFRLGVLSMSLNETEDGEMIDNGKIYKIEESHDETQLVKENHPGCEGHDVLYDNTKISKVTAPKPIRAIKESSVETQVVKEKDIPTHEVHTRSNDEIKIGVGIPSAMICTIERNLTRLEGNTMPHHETEADETIDNGKIYWTQQPNSQTQLQKDDHPHLEDHKKISREIESKLIGKVEGSIPETIDVREKDVPTLQIHTSANNDAKIGIEVISEIIFKLKGNDSRRPQANTMPHHETEVGETEQPNSETQLQKDDHPHLKDHKTLDDDTKISREMDSEHICKVEEKNLETIVVQEKDIPTLQVHTSVNDDAKIGIEAPSELIFKMEDNDSTRPQANTMLHHETGADEIEQPNSGTQLQKDYHPHLEDHKALDDDNKISREMDSEHICKVEEKNLETIVVQEKDIPTLQVHTSVNDDAKIGIEAPSELIFKMEDNDSTRPQANTMLHHETEADEIEQPNSGTQLQTDYHPHLEDHKALDDDNKILREMDSEHICKVEEKNLETIVVQEKDIPTLQVHTSVNDDAKIGIEAPSELIFKMEDNDSTRPQANTMLHHETGADEIEQPNSGTQLQTDYHPHLEDHKALDDDNKILREMDSEHICKVEEKNLETIVVQEKDIPNLQVHTSVNDDAKIGIEAPSELIFKMEDNDSTRPQANTMLHHETGADEIEQPNSGTQMQTDYHPHLEDHKALDDDNKILREMDSEHICKVEEKNLETIVVQEKDIPTLQVHTSVNDDAKIGIEAPSELIFKMEDNDSTRPQANTMLHHETEADEIEQPNSGTQLQTDYHPHLEDHKALDDDNKILREMDSEHICKVEEKNLETIVVQEKDIPTLQVHTSVNDDAKIGIEAPSELIFKMEDNDSTRPQANTMLHHETEVDETEQPNSETQLQKDDHPHLKDHKTLDDDTKISREMDSQHICKVEEKNLETIVVQEKDIPTLQVHTSVNDDAKIGIEAPSELIFKMEDNDSRRPQANTMLHHETEADETEQPNSET